MRVEGAAGMSKSVWTERRRVAFMGGLHEPPQSLPMVFCCGVFKRVPCCFSPAALGVGASERHQDPSGDDKVCKGHQGFSSPSSCFDYYGGPFFRLLAQHAEHIRGPSEWAARTPNLHQECRRSRTQLTWAWHVLSGVGCMRVLLSEARALSLVLLFATPGWVHPPTEGETRGIHIPARARGA
jgi:hypothetical protein